jgi:hypothetical protein
MSKIFGEIFIVVLRVNSITNVLLFQQIKVKVKVKVKQSRYRPGVAQRVPAS